MLRRLRIRTRRFLTGAIPRKALFSLMAVALAAGLGVGAFSPDPVEARAYRWLVDHDQPDGILSKELNGDQDNQSFKFIQISDPHVGEGFDNYGEDVYQHGWEYDRPPVGDAGLGAQYLRSCVEWINSNYISEDIRFVIVTGDLTQSGEWSEFQKAKEILDCLRIPYIPVLGNHDIWPYSKNGDGSYDEADTPMGDQYFKETFSSTFDSLSQAFPGWDDGLRLTLKNGKFFQTFAFPYNGYWFIMADFVDRGHALPTYPGALPGGRPWDAPGGSWEWVKNKVQDICQDPYYTDPDHNDHILIFAHHGPDHDAAEATLELFDPAECNTIGGDLLPYQDAVGLWAAGHYHYNRAYTVVKCDDWLFHWVHHTICPGEEAAGYDDWNVGSEINAKLYTLHGVENDDGPIPWDPGEINSATAAAYRFDEGVPGVTGQDNVVIWDMSGSDYDGLAQSNGTFEWMEGASGSSIVFNGDDWVEVPPSAGLDVTQNFTIEAWVYPTSPSRGGIIAHGTEVQVSYELWYESAQKIGYRHNWGTGHAWEYLFTTDGSVLVGQWTHIAVVYTDKCATIYVNGLPNVTGTFARNPVPLPEGNLWMGCHRAGLDEYYHGSIDNLRIYQTAYTDYEILSHSATGMWSMTETDDDTFADSSWYGHDGMTYGASFTDQALTGTGLTFSGHHASWARLPRGALDGLEDFTFECWVETGDSVAGLISAANSGCDNEFLIYLTPVAQVYIKGVARYVGFTVDDAQWHHIAVTRSGGTVSAYKDGVLGYTWTDFPDQPLDVDGLYLGQDQDWVDGGFSDSQAFNGHMDDIAIYGRAFSEVEIQARHQAGTTIARWPMNENALTDVRDSGVQGYDATTTGSWVDGITGSGLNFAGLTSEYAKLPAAALDYAPDFSFECWIKTTDSVGAIISAANSNCDNEFLVYFDPTVKIYVEGSYEDTGITVNDGLWHHLAVNQIGHTVSVSKDGAPCYTWADAISGALHVDSDGLWLAQEQDSVGGGFNNDQALNGVLDEVSIRRVLNPCKLELEVGFGNGSTSPVPGAFGYQSYAPGSVVSVTAIPADGYAFDYWAGDVADHLSASTTVTMNGDSWVEANFCELPGFDLTIGVQNEGGTTDPAPGTYHYLAGTEVTIRAFPGDGWEFFDWSGGVTDPWSAETTVIMDSNKYVYADFVEYTPAILYNASVSPMSGDKKTLFTYQVTWYDDNGDAPTAAADIYIDGTPYPMTWVSGPYGGTMVYEYSTKLGKGRHSYYFVFSDGVEQARAPAFGEYAGPNVNVKAVVEVLDFSTGAGVDKFARYYESADPFNTKSLTPPGGPETEFDAYQYSCIAADDGQRTGFSGTWDRQYRFTYNIPQDLLPAMDFEISVDLWAMEGQHTELWIWLNTADTEWDIPLDGHISVTSGDIVLQGTVTGNAADYVDANGDVHIAVVAYHPTGGQCSLNTDYTYLEVTH